MSCWRSRGSSRSTSPSCSGWPADGLRHTTSCCCRCSSSRRLGIPRVASPPLGAAVVIIALMPAVYAPDGDGLQGMVAELAVWSGVIGVLSVLMARVRGQRIAQAELARSDQLTSLANRRALDEHFEGTRTANVVLAIGDVNDFKHINDRYGHLAGDTCLSEIAAVLSADARAGDQVFRWGATSSRCCLPQRVTQTPGRCSSAWKPRSRLASSTLAERRSRSRLAGPTADRTRICARSPVPPMRCCSSASSAFASGSPIPHDTDKPRLAPRNPCAGPGSTRGGLTPFSSSLCAAGADGERSQTAL